MAGAKDSFEDYADRRFLTSYPEAFETAFRRLETPHTFFFNTKSHKLLAEYEGKETFVARCLLLANLYSEKRFGKPLRLSCDERRLMSRYCLTTR